nr:TetR/AcrR family transcriptional regulator [Aestuariicella hydrocarbonica]
MTKKTADKGRLSKQAQTKPRVRATRMSPEARRANLLQGLLHICAEKGLGEAYHSDVAAWAGVSVPTVFHYFPTKEEMVEVVIAEVSRFLIEDIVGPHSDETDNASDSVVHILMAFCDAIDDHPDYVRVWLEWSVAVRGTLWEEYLRFYENALRGVKRVLLRGLRDGSIDRGVNIDVACRVIVGAAHMIAQMRFAGSNREQILETVTSLVNTYLGDRK